MSRTAVITSIEIATHHGIGVDAFWSAMNNEVCLPQRHVFCDENLMEHQQAYSLSKHLQDLPYHNYKDASALSITLITELFKKAKLDPFKENKVDVILGSGMGNINHIEQAFHDNKNIHPRDQFNFDVVCDIANHFNFVGECINNASGCAASGYAISLALQNIRSGQSDIVVTGGIDLGGRVVQGCFNSMRALDDCCQPFSIHRSGTVFGQACGFLLIESEEHFLSRSGNTAYGSLAGLGWSCDSYHVTAPETNGNMQEKALIAALNDAQISPPEVSCILPHATGTKLNDQVEYSVLKKVFDSQLAEIPITAIKSHTGHSGGSSAAVSAVAAALILNTQKVPQIANTKQLEHDVNLNFNSPTKSTINNVLINAYGFGGNNYSMLIKRYQ
ncbi:beta-ketoacyl synthase N-terminal-like domain-containing protein [Aliikangiella sp. IMCC44359]|uniref:beta-ketoacyl synthase N-terminal-like domain-containing protein n=1 Tax=Aliikangiella sp. IMCC44359 TaxID=3459125 RepID=UPI00403AC797